MTLNCTNCGKELIEGAKFCLECGTKAPEASQDLSCKSCGKELVAGAKFCLECGAKVGGANDNMILVCGKCGAIPKEGKKFCSKCGANVSETGVMKPREETAKQAEIEKAKTVELEKEEPTNNAQQMEWVCNVCGYVHREDELPDCCPICKVPSGKFSKTV